MFRGFLRRKLRAALPSFCEPLEPRRLMSYASAPASLTVGWLTPPTDFHATAVSRNEIDFSWKMPTPAAAIHS